MRYTIAAKFRIAGTLRYLSHQETARLFQRALVRSGIRLSYSEGFNPRPRISLPLPRSVGLEGDAELLCAVIETSADPPAACPPGRGEARDEAEEYRFIGIDAEQIKRKLERQLPPDCCLVSLDLIKGKAKFHPVTAVYEFEVARAALLEKIKLKAGSRYIGNEHLFIERRINEKGDTRTVDVGGFIESVDFEGLKVAVTCKIEPSGTIRVDEIVKLLGDDESVMASSVKRTYIEWRTVVS